MCRKTDCVHPATVSRGYDPPEYAKDRELTKKSDIYSFGVVLLELLTGRKALDLYMPDGQQCIVKWAYPKLSKERVKECVDPKLEEDYPPNAVLKFAAVAALCVQYKAEYRIEAHDSVKALQSLLVTPAPARGIHALSLKELKEKTDNFGEKAYIGGGSIHGRMYVAQLENGKNVAVRTLDVPPVSTAEFFRQGLVPGSKHENVVELLGEWVEGNLRVLALEFATMGSLHDILHGRMVKGVVQPGPVLYWMQRVKIAVDTARGLEYLHDKAELIHRNIKSTNVLLFEDYKAKIAEPTISSWAPDKCCRKTDCVQPVALTRGYTPLPTRAEPRLSEDKVKQCVDPKLEGDYPTKAVARLAAVAAFCVKYEAEFRLDAHVVVKTLPS